MSDEGGKEAISKEHTKSVDTSCEEYYEPFQSEAVGSGRREPETPSCHCDQSRAGAGNWRSLKESEQPCLSAIKFEP